MKTKHNLTSAIQQALNDALIANKGKTYQIVPSISYYQIKANEKKKQSRIKVQELKNNED